VSYWQWLVAISLAFAALERLRPARPEQRALRPQLANDLVLLAVNGHLFALVAGALLGWIGWSAVLGSSGPQPLAPLGVSLAEWPAAAQFVVLLVAADLLQWCVHRLLHAVPFLWQFHKLHHSIHAMDWAGAFRFHWVELIVYRSLLYLPLTLLGGSGQVLLAVAVFATAWGHFNHSNLDLGIGHLGYLFNSPRMHLWHHDASAEGGAAKNFGIVLSVWDWIFGTAYWPRERAPERIGYAGDAEMPAGVLPQLAFPATARRGRDDGIR
jgi:sterol desaturase/sphingolipid hydroxylase (fatty acid hydroxylase superfamily)